MKASIFDEDGCCFNKSLEVFIRFIIEFCDMKMRIVYLLGFMVFSFAADAQKNLDTHASVTNTVTYEKPVVQKKVIQKPAVELTFENEMIDLGEVKQGDKRTFDFIFTNTGTETIEIEIVSGCECSTLDWTFKPIPPGEKGKVNVIFDSTEKEASETVDIDLTLKNINPETGYQIFKIVNFKFTLIK